ncbi:MAG: RNA ligase family protein [Planctomycetes bacterium]|nr:RNA ligase family protein [Planctomycetota bacterium]
MRKYPRTPHLRGSTLQPGDEGLKAVAFEEVASKPLVVEEKLDGSNAGLSFAPDGTLLLQSRGHYLRGGEAERHFALFKRWAHTHREPLWAALRARYLVYGEWLYAKHTVFYDALPHYFLEFDVYDRERERFLDRAARAELLAGLPIASVPVLGEGRFASLDQVLALLGPSVCKSPGWGAGLLRAAEAEGLDPARIALETDPSDLAEGLYLKWEEAGEVRARFKFVRASFSQRVLDSGSHWKDRPVVKNALRPEVDVFAGTP